MQTKSEADQVLLSLWEGSGLVSKDDLADYKCISKDLQISVTQAIKSSGLVTDFGLALSNEAQRQVLAQEVTPDLAIRALRIAVQGRMSFPAAVDQARKLHQKTQVVVSATNLLTELMLESGMLTKEALGPLLVLSHESSVMIGQVMTLNKVISSENLLSVLNAILMIREEAISKETAVKGLKHAYRQDISLEQALFELGLFVHPDSKTTRIGELFVMADLMSKAALAECLEIELFKEKQFGQILLERGLATNEQLHCAVSLLSSISNEELLPYQAAVALREVVQEDKNIYACLAELKASQENSDSRLGDILVDSGICQKDSIESALSNQSDSAVKVGSLLLKSKILSEPMLYKALRLQTALRLGYVSRTNAVKLLKGCFESESSLESVCEECSSYIPSRMQWTWV